MKKETLFSEARTHILEKMRELLQAGITRLPTERELANEVAASYSTVRLVMAELEKQGYIRCIRRAGTFIQPQADELLKRKLMIYILPYVNDPDAHFGAYFIRELNQTASARNYTTEVRQVHNHDEFLRDLFSIQNSVDAVAYLPHPRNFTMHQLGMLADFDSAPLVILDTDMGNVDINNISTDNYRGGMLAAHALLHAGRRRLLLLQTEPLTLQCRKRIRGFQDMLSPFGIEPCVINSEVFHGEDRFGKTCDQITRILHNGTRFDGIFCVSDAGATAVSQALIRNGITPGKEISLIGFDGLPVGRHSDPTLASIAQPVQEIAEELFVMISNWKPQTFTSRLLQPKFQAGETLGNSREITVSGKKRGNSLCGKTENLTILNLTTP